MFYVNVACLSKRGVRQYSIVLKLFREVVLEVEGACSFMKFCEKRVIFDCGSLL